jgi:hypothetical protein
MAAHEARSRPPGNLARWLVLLVALAGLMAMHGLSDHGVGGPVVGSGAAAPMAGHDHEGGGAGSDHGGGHGGDGGMLTGLCLAVLVALLPFVVATARTRLPRALADGLRDRAAVVGTAIRARARGPGAPDLRMLSVQRC